MCAPLPAPPTAARAGSRWARFEPLLYAAFACGSTLWVALQFYGQLRLQLAMSAARGLPHASAAEWSAPLDDVFIHFDFARSAARGAPFEWSPGNGYSSGGTSLLYPLVLALGYLAGFHQDLMLFAAVVACVSVAATLLGARALFRNLPRWASYTAPVALLCVGGLSWTFFSGMEVALFLAAWSASLVVWDELVQRAAGALGAPREAPPRALAALLGACLALVVALRPEAVLTVAVFSVSAAAAVRRRAAWRGAFVVLVLSALPGALIVVGHAVANRTLTGEWSAAGALAKLEVHHPRLSRQEVWDAWKHFCSYQVLRITRYHLSTLPGVGWLVWVLAAVGVCSRRTRARSLLLWVNAALWVLLVALNGQVRWQNERYTMPAVAWLLLAAGLGLSLLLDVGLAGLLGGRGAPPTRWRPLRRGAGAVAVLGAVAAVVTFGVGQAPRMRQQLWFFGRASRNIHDQHLRVARILTELVPRPRRVLLGDAGAIPFGSDLPALDAIGLGGYHDLPFARASRWGTGATLELIERLPASDRPDVFAIYPSWWGDLPRWFGRPLAEVMVPGNVICGGPVKGLYRADWSPLVGSAVPLAMGAGSRVIEELDLADLVDEARHRYQADRPAQMTMKLLPHPGDPEGRPLWDAGRIFAEGSRLSFRTVDLPSGVPLRLVLRVAPANASMLEVTMDGAVMGRLELPTSDDWIEPSVALPARDRPAPASFELRVHGGELMLYHLWLVRGP